MDGFAARHREARGPPHPWFTGSLPPVVADSHPSLPVLLPGPSLSLPPSFPLIPGRGHTSLETGGGGLVTSGVGCGLPPGGGGGFSLPKSRSLLSVWRDRLQHVLTLLGPTFLCDLSIHCPSVTLSFLIRKRGSVISAVKYFNKHELST